MELIKTKELAKRTGIPYGTLYTWRTVGVIPPDCWCKPTNGTILFIYEKFMKWLTNIKTPADRKIGFTL